MKNYFYPTSQINRLFKLTEIHKNTLYLKRFILYPYFYGTLKLHKTPLPKWSLLSHSGIYIYNRRVRGVIRSALICIALNYFLLFGYQVSTSGYENLFDFQLLNYDDGK